MDKNERRLQPLDLIVVIVLMTIGCFVGKYVMDNVSDTWIGFNGPALGILAVGELIWWRVRKLLIEHWGEK